MRVEEAIRARLYEQLGMCPLIEALDYVRGAANLIEKAYETFSQIALEMLEADPETFGPIIEDAIKSMDHSMARAKRAQGSD